MEATSIDPLVTIVMVVGGVVSSGVLGLLGFARVAVESRLNSHWL